MLQRGGHLAVLCGGVCALEKDVQELLVGPLRGVVMHLYRLGVAGAAGAHLAVGWVWHVALGVAHRGVLDAGNPLVCKLEAPEAPLAAMASGEGGGQQAALGGTGR